MSEETVTVRLTQRHDFQFDNQFGAAAPALLADEPAPLGQGAGPSPVQLLAAAVGNCLSASLLFSLRKLKQTAEPLACEMQAQVGRAADKHLRVLGLQARLTLGVCRALGRACVEAGNGLSLGAMHSHALRHGAQWQRRISVVIGQVPKIAPQKQVVHNFRLSSTAALWVFLKRAHCQLQPVGPGRFSVPSVVVGSLWGAIPRLADA